MISSGWGWINDQGKYLTFLRLNYDDNIFICPAELEWCHVWWRNDPCHAHKTCDKIIKLQLLVKCWQMVARGVFSLRYRGVFVYWRNCHEKLESENCHKKFKSINHLNDFFKPRIWEQQLLYHRMRNCVMSKNQIIIFINENGKIRQSLKLIFFYGTPIYLTKQ